MDAGELREDLRRPDHLSPRARALAKPGDDSRGAGRRLRSRGGVSGRSSASAAPPKPYPSIALGVFEATPYEIATAYTLFPNLGLIRPLKHILQITSGGKDVTKKPTAMPRRGRAAGHDVPRDRT